MSEGEYGEVHHIVPKSEVGSDEPNNLVKLTAREHYVAHLLLARIYNDEKMWSAVVFMRTGRHKGRNFKSNSRLYDKARKEFGKRHSEHMKMLARTTNFGEKVSVAKRGKTHKGTSHSEETKKRLSELHKGTKASEETRRKLSEMRKGKPSGMKGKHLSEETRHKLSVSLKGIRTGTKWYTNGVQSKQLKECPEGWWAGKSKKKKEVE